jgi:endonuclease/exonuclease/phosphatase (EEP) superfamily protein YafD
MKNARIQARFQALVVVYLAALAAIAVLLGAATDVLWPATVLAFAPRWVWGVPLLLLAPAAAVLHRPWLLLALMAGAVVWAGPILDVRIPVARLARGGAARDLRVMTYNIGGGDIAPEALRAQVKELDVDVLAVQERSFALGGRDLPRFPYSGSCDSEQCLWSRFPIVSREARDRSDLLAMHGSGSMVQYRVRARRGTIRVVNVHLATVREGLAAVLRQALGGAPALEENTRERALESQIARAFAARGTGPLLVMGDFNLPVESAVFRRSWGSFHNALSEACWGICRTKHTRWHGVRIDHVLAGPGWEVIDAFVAPGLGGDHRPVVADLRWVGGAIADGDREQP